METQFFRARKQEELLEEMERQRLHEEEYFKVTQKDVENLRKQETLGKLQKNKLKWRVFSFFRKVNFHFNFLCKNYIIGLVTFLYKFIFLAAMQLMLASDDQSKLVVQKYLEEQEQARLIAQQSMGEDTEKLRAELMRQQSTQNVLVQKIVDEVQYYSLYKCISV